MLRPIRDPATAALGAILLLFTINFGISRAGFFSVAVADEVSYITAGLNLVHQWEYTNPFGQPETWFPPMFPLMIGIANTAGMVDPHFAARLVSVLFAVMGIVLVFRVTHRAFDDRTTALLSAGFLAANPTYQYFACSALSESMATTLNIAAFLAWLNRHERNGWMSAILLGMLSGVGTLTRPEAVLLLPLWFAIDLVLEFRKSGLAKCVPVVTAGTISAATCLMVMLPYATYLHRTTGKWTFTNKGAVNLAAGKSSYYGIPREHIDPETLEMDLFKHSATASEESRRYVHNLGKYFAGFGRMYRGPLALVVAGTMIAGGVCLLRDGRARFLAGLIAQFIFLFIAAFYDISGEKNLHAVTPAFAILCASGTAATWRRLGMPATWWSRAAAYAGLLLLCAVVLEGSTRCIRWYRAAEDLPVTQLRDAGVQLRSIFPARGVVYEVGATVGYYGAKRRGRLTSNSLETLTRYVLKHEAANEPVFLALSSIESQKLDPSVRELLARVHDPWTPVLRLNDARGRLVVYQLDRRNAR